MVGIRDPPPPPFVDIHDALCSMQSQHLIFNNKILLHGYQHPHENLFGKFSRKHSKTSLGKQKNDIGEDDWNLTPSWWRHQMEIFSAYLAICAGNSPVPGEFSAQRPVTRSFDAFFDLRLNKRLCKQSWDWWFETPSHPLWRHCNDSKHYRNGRVN